MLALFGNLSLMEILVVLVGAVLAFGRDLPQAAMRGAAQFVRLKRQVQRVWREAGLEDELRRVRWDLEREARDAERRASLKNLEDAPAPPRLPALVREDDPPPAPADQVEGEWSREVATSGPSAEEARAERGKDSAGHSVANQAASLPPGEALP